MRKSQPLHPTALRVLQACNAGTGTGWGVTLNLLLNPNPNLIVGALSMSCLCLVCKMASNWRGGVNVKEVGERGVALVFHLGTYLVLERAGRGEEGRGGGWGVHHKFLAMRRARVCLALFLFTFREDTFRLFEIRFQLPDPQQGLLNFIGLQTFLFQKAHTLRDRSRLFLCGRFGGLGRVSIRPCVQNGCRMAARASLPIDWIQRARLALVILAERREDKTRQDTTRHAKTR
jgi:hypothetical protein